MRSISITRVLANYAEQHECIFTVDGEVEPAVLVFSAEVFLPVIALHADLSARSVLGYSLGVDIVPDEQSLLGVSANIEPLTGDEISALRVVFFIRAMHEIFGLSSESKQIECAPVFAAYEHGLLRHIEENGDMTWPVATVLQR